MSWPRRDLLWESPKRSEHSRRHVAATRRGDKSLPLFVYRSCNKLLLLVCDTLHRTIASCVLRIVLVEIFVFATGFCRRKSSQFKFVRVNCVTCRGDKILPRGQEFDCTKITQCTRKAICCCVMLSSFTNLTL